MVMCFISRMLSGLWIDEVLKTIYEETIFSYYRMGNSLAQSKVSDLYSFRRFLMMIFNSFVFLIISQILLTLNIIYLIPLTIYDIFKTLLYYGTSYKPI